MGDEVSDWESRRRRYEALWTATEVGLPPVGPEYREALRGLWAWHRERLRLGEIAREKAPADRA